MPTTASELASIAENAGQLNVAAPHVLAFTETIAQLGETTDLSFDAASTSLARFLNITGGGTGMIEDVANVIVELGNNSETTESQIVGLSMRLAGAFSAAGASESQILAVAAAYSSLGVEAEAGGTALSKVMTAMVDAAATGSPPLKTFAETAGLLPAEFKKIVETNPVEALRLFEEGLGGVLQETKTITPVLSELGLSGDRVTAVLTRGALASDKLGSSLRLAEGALRDGTALSDEYAKRMATAAAKIDVFKNRISGIAIAVGSTGLVAFAAAVDGAGDAISKVSEIVGPAAGEITEFVGGIAGLGADLIGVFGSPALQAAGAILIAVSAGLEAIFEGLNALGPVITVLSVLAADILLVGPASMAAAAGLSTLGTSFGAMAAASGPLLALGVVLAGIGYWIKKTGDAAKAAAQQISDEFISALEDGDYAAVATQLREVSDEFDRLKEASTLAAPETPRWGKFGEVLSTVNDKLNGTGNGLGRINADKAAGEIEILKDGVSELADKFGLSETEALNFSKGLGAMSAALELPEAQVLRLAEGLGLIPDVAASGTTGVRQLMAGFTEAGFAIRDAAAAEAEFSGTTGILYDDILDGTVTLREWAKALGVSEEALRLLSDQSDDFDINDLIGEDATASVDAYNAALGLLTEKFGPMAQAAGLTVEAFLRQRDASNDLVASFSELEAAIGRVTDRQAALTTSLALAANSQEVFNAALAAGDFEAAAKAMGDYTSKLAESGAPIGEVTRAQGEMRSAFEASAEAAGLSASEIDALLISYGLLTGAEIAEIQIEGTENISDAVIVVADLKYGLDELTAAEYIVEISGDTGLAEEAFERALFFGEAWAVQLFEAKISGNVEDAEAAFQTALNAGEDWATRIFEAVLNADPTGAMTDSAAASEAAKGYADGDYTALLNADMHPAEATFATALFLGEAWATSLFEAVIDANPTLALDAAAASEAAANAFADGSYVGMLDGDEAAAAAAAAAATSAANTFADGAYMALLEADEAAAVMSAAVATAAADAFADTTYSATLIADATGAMGVIATALTAALTFGGSYTASLTTTHTTVNKTVNTKPTYDGSGIGQQFSAAGGVIDFYADGGINLGRQADDIANNHIARVLPAGTWRVSGEDETLGEAYIPFADDWRRDGALKVWHESGRRLGVEGFAAGGHIAAGNHRMAAASNFGHGGPAVSFGDVVTNVQVPLGADAKQVADIAAKSVRKGLNDFARDLSRGLATSR